MLVLLVAIVCFALCLTLIPVVDLRCFVVNIPAQIAFDQSNIVIGWGHLGYLDQA